jgi:hypothetical protein
LNKQKYILLTWFAMIGTIAFAQQISLAGKWTFAMDNADIGIKEKWFNKKLGGFIQLPGTMNTNNLGNEVSLRTQWTASIYDSSFFFQPRLAPYQQPGNIKIPFWLTPLKYYVGAAWYQKEIEIPANWKEKRITFFIERTHIASTVWLDGEAVDSLQNSLVAPHQYNLTKFATPGKHILTVRIDNRLTAAEVGQDSHSVSDHTQGNWNGMIGKISLTATAPVRIEQLQVYPFVEEKKIKITGVLINETGKQLAETIHFNVSGNNAVTTIIAPIKGQFAATSITQWEQWIDMGNGVKAWNEFHPNLYTLTASTTTSQQKIVFGMREVKVDGKQILLNKQPLFLRGNLNNCEFPLTGHPPMDVKSWLQLMTTLKRFGINHIRFHSWCPPDAAFIAADQLGIYLQPEAPTWPNHGTSVGDGRFIDNYIYEESKRMIEQYGNHPSFIMMAAGNEPAGKNQSKYLAHFVHYWKAKDKRRIYTGASVATSWPLVPENEYMVKSGARGLNWNTAAPNTIDDYNSTIEKYPVPFVQHEQGQWCVFPDFSEIAKYTGAYKARNLELFKEDLAQQGMLPQAHNFLMASGKLQALCYKMEIERSLRTKDIAGFQLLGLQDFPGQGTALVGVLNAFYQEKGYISSNEFNKFCNTTVPLLKAGKFTWLNNETLEAEALLFHFGEKDLQHAALEWTLRNEQGGIIEKGVSEANKFKTGTVTTAGFINIALNKFTKAQQLTLQLKVKGTTYTNQWNFWVYPAGLPVIENDEPYYTDTLDARAEEILSNGGKVFLQLYGKIKKGKEVVQSFTPVFWNTSWFKMRPPHTLGLWIDTTNTVFKNFPGSYHSDLQWWEIVTKAQVMHLEDFPKDFMPLISNIDTWFMNRKLAMLFEVKVGKGKLMVCSADVLLAGKERPVARQLWYSIRKYMNSGAFNPKTKVPLLLIKKLMTEDSKYVFDAFTKDSPDELKPIK